MKNPPRTTTIKGQKHLLEYITPDEAKLLKAMGGSGEKVNGIPSFSLTRVWGQAVTLVLMAAVSIVDIAVPAALMMV